MAVDPLSITTAIITLGNTLERAINLLNDIQDAPRRLVEIKTDCNLTQGVLSSIRRQLRATEATLPTLHIYGSEDEDAGVNLANLLRDNVDQLQLDLNSLLSELERLGRTRNSESRIDGWMARGALGLRMSYLTAMQRNIVTKRGQLQLVQNSLQMYAAAHILWIWSFLTRSATLQPAYSRGNIKSTNKSRRRGCHAGRWYAEALRSDINRDPNNTAHLNSNNGGSATKPRVEGQTHESCEEEKPTGCRNAPP